MAKYLGREVKCNVGPRCRSLGPSFGPSFASKCYLPSSGVSDKKVEAEEEEEEEEEGEGLATRTVGYNGRFSQKGTDNRVISLVL